MPARQQVFILWPFGDATVWRGGALAARVTSPALSSTSLSSRGGISNKCSLHVRVCVSVCPCGCACVQGGFFLDACIKLFLGGWGELPRKQSLLCLKFIWAIHVCRGSAQKLQAERRLQRFTEILRGKRRFSVGGRRRKHALSWVCGCCGRWHWRGKCLPTV